MKKNTIGLRTAVIALVVVPGFVVTASAAAATVTTAAASRAAHVSAVRNAGPDIISHACDSATRTWVHLTFTIGSECFFGPGTVRLTTNQTIKICSGNNFGDIFYFSSSGLHELIFSPGQTKSFSPAVNVEELTITSSSGSDTC